MTVADFPHVVEVTGIGFWSPRLPSWELACDVLAGRATALDQPQARAAPALLAPTERRRAPDTVGIALEVASRACAMAGVEAAVIPSVFASTHGDLAISDYMCSTLATTPTLCSPTKFHNSVHNAASGYWTMGTQCVAPSTALTAWTHTFANGLLEALVQVLADRTPVLYVAYDIASSGPLSAVTHSEGLLAMAVVLTPPGAGQRAGSTTLRWDVRAAGDAPEAATLPPAWRSVMPDNAMNQCLGFLDVLARRVQSRMTCPLSDGCDLVLGISPYDGAR